MLSNVTNIIRLNLSRNKLSILPNILFREFSKLQHLDLHENRLVCFDLDLFNGARSLAYLYLHNNKLVMLPNGLFQELISLTVLTLHTNKLKAYPLIFLQVCSTWKVCSCRIIIFQLLVIKYCMVCKAYVT